MVFKLGRTALDEAARSRENVSLLAPSLTATWNGLPFAWVGTPEGPWTSSFTTLAPTLSLIESGAVTSRMTVGGRGYDLNASAGSLTLFNAETRVRVSQVDCRDARRLLLPLDLTALEHQGLEREDLLVNLRQAVEFYDPALTAVLRAMLREVKRGCPNGSLYAESLSCGVLAHLIRSRGQAPVRERGKLTEWQWSRLNELIAEKPMSELTLMELSTSVGMSKSQFVRIFRKSTGTSPHQFIVHKQLEVARGLIRSSNSTLVDVVAKAGFASQSHFTRLFRDTYGITPGEFRRKAGSAPSR